MPHTTPSSSVRPRGGRRAASVLRPSPLLFPVALAGAALILGACGAGDPALAGPAYTTGRVQARTLDIQVFRSGTEVRLTNTTANPLPAGRLWINDWFSHAVEPLGVGQNLTLSLWDFRDRYGDAFRAGGFFAAEQPDTIVQAQWETAGTGGEGRPGELLGLVVVEGR